MEREGEGDWDHHELVSQVRFGLGNALRSAAKFIIRKVVALLEMLGEMVVLDFDESVKMQEKEDGIVRILLLEKQIVEYQR